MRACGDSAQLREEQFIHLPTIQCIGEGSRVASCNSVRSRSRRKHHADGIKAGRQLKLTR
jgi:hypothetical protein